MAPRCGDCGYPMRFLTGKTGFYFGCTRWPVCKGTIGAHADGRPMGRPADKETRQARMKAHAAFDSLWKSGQMKRSQAYDLAAKIMNRSKKSMHIALMDKAECEELAKKIVNFLAK